jgi:hypothetical protein
MDGQLRFRDRHQQRQGENILEQSQQPEEGRRVRHELAVFELHPVDQSNACSPSITRAIARPKLQLVGDTPVGNCKVRRSIGNSTSSDRRNALPGGGKLQPTQDPSAFGLLIADQRHRLRERAPIRL